MHILIVRRDCCSKVSLDLTMGVLALEVENRSKGVLFVAALRSECRYELNVDF